jgi:G3E family GTPase
VNLASDLDPRSVLNLMKTISTVTVPIPILDEKGLQRLDLWFQKVLWESELPEKPQHVGELAKEFNIHRTKGLLVLKTGDIRMVQGVREVFEITDLNRKAESGQKGKLVLIGKNIQTLAWERSLAVYLGEAA